MQDTTPHHGKQGTPTGFVTLISTKHPDVFDIRIAGPFGFRFVAKLQGNTLKKRVKPEHILHAVNGVCFSAAIILSSELHFDWIEADIDGRRLYTSRNFFRDHAVPFHSRGFEPQLALPLDLWSQERPTACEMADTRKSHSAKQESPQLTLFVDPK